MGTAPVRPTQDIIDLAFADLWNAIRDSQLSILYHRERAEHFERQQTRLEILSVLLAVIAGGGLIEFPEFRGSTWALLAFCSAIVGQLPYVLRLMNRKIEHQRLGNDWGSVMVDLQRVLNNARSTNSLTAETHNQLLLCLEKYNFVSQRDTIDYDLPSVRAIQKTVALMYPPSEDWKP